ncbi:MULTISPECIES: translational GTPase TypA [unclassified Clostridium]|uniref:translational GTPase TypA n=1 Tax=unclassified Clostridium TaxID=2614128 RepID=UPI001FAA6925|nr:MULTISPECIES: translational GTPase TypA [unclassified Clostridium]
MIKERNDVRNVAIIAHVDHGKTTLVDGLLRQGGVFRDNQAVQERVMDSGDLERERGITILSKNTAVHYKGYRINIVDTPGHADFGGEVERVLKMVDGVLLLVDAFEGPMPQTRFVLRRALELNHRVIVVINKTDRPDARPEAVIDEVLELFMELDANDEQLDSPFIFASARNGTATTDLNAPGESLLPLLDAIIDYVPAPKGDFEGPAQVLVSTIDYNDYVGRIGVGRVERGEIRVGQDVVVSDFHGNNAARRTRVSNLFIYDGLKRMPVESAQVGDIVAVSGIEDINIGDTICDAACPEPLPFVNITEPTVAMTFSVNDSPLAGTEGKFVTSRHLRARLFREVETDVSLRVEETDSADSFKVSGRGELHLSILIETMRRQGYEFQVSKPEVLYHEVDGKMLEPVERVVIEVPEENMGPVIEEMGRRKGEMLNMAGGQGVMMRLEFKIPSRGLFGYRSKFMTDTKGEGIMHAVFEGYEPVKGEIASRAAGALIAHEAGETVTYGLFNAQDRGTMFVGPGEKVYAGMIVGENARTDDIEVNVCKKKHVTNMRASGSDEALRLTPPRNLSLEDALEWLGEDELLEVTPKSLRLRKKILDSLARMRYNKRLNQAQNS